MDSIYLCEFGKAMLICFVVSNAIIKTNANWKKLLKWTTLRLHDICSGDTNSRGGGMKAFAPLPIILKLKKIWKGGKWERQEKERNKNGEK